MNKRDLVCQYNELIHFHNDHAYVKALVRLMPEILFTLWFTNFFVFPTTELNRLGVPLWCSQRGVHCFIFSREIWYVLLNERCSIKQPLFSSLYLLRELSYKKIFDQEVFFVRFMGNISSIFFRNNRNITQIQNQYTKL